VPSIRYAARRSHCLPRAPGPGAPSTPGEAMPLSENQRMFRQAARDFATAKIAPIGDVMFKLVNFSESF
jgi:hypothetical protein